MDLKPLPIPKIPQYEHHQPIEPNAQSIMPLVHITEVHANTLAIKAIGIKMVAMIVKVFMISFCDQGNSINTHLINSITYLIRFNHQSPADMIIYINVNINGIITNKALLPICDTWLITSRIGQMVYVIIRFAALIYTRCGNVAALVKQWLGFLHQFDR